MGISCDVFYVLCLSVLPLCMSAPHACWCSQSSEEGIRSLRTGVIGGCETSIWELYLGPLQEQQELSTTELSLRPLLVSLELSLQLSSQLSNHFYLLCFKSKMEDFPPTPLVDLAWRQEKASYLFANVLSNTCEFALPPMFLQPQFQHILWTISPFPQT